jgi:hypothetical protein
MCHLVPVPTTVLAARMASCAGTSFSAVTAPNTGVRSLYANAVAAAAMAATMAATTSTGPHPHGNFPPSDSPNCRVTAHGNKT